jgi:hypothetical protein
MKIIAFNECKGCPHHDVDPQTVNELYWGRDCCIKDWDNTPQTEDMIKLVDPDKIHPDCTLSETCPLPEPWCYLCRYLTQPDYTDPCYSCKDHDKWEIR